MNENTLELAIIQHLTEKTGYQYTHGSQIHKKQSDVTIKDDLTQYLKNKYSGITENEIKTITAKLENLSSGDLYTANKQILKWLSEGFTLKREDQNKKDLFINLIDYSPNDSNIYRLVNQLEITGTQKRIPDIILFINGLPIIVFELKNPAKEYTNLEGAYIQLTTRYKRDIPELFKYNAALIISDGANSKYGTLFTPYEYYYTWRQKTETEQEVKGGIPALFTLLEGLLEKQTLKNIIKNYIWFPDKSDKTEKIICRYPQYFAAEALHKNIKNKMKPEGNGKGGTYFGATGSGKSYTMLYLTRKLMKDAELKSPTIILITDRTDLDDQLSEKFTNAKEFIGDASVRNITSRDKLREELQNRPSGGVFLTTVQKFTEDTTLLSDRSNIICISDEAHRSQLNLDQTVKTTEKGIRKSYGFAKYLHDSLPNATYVGFTGTPIDETMEVFGPIVQSYTMQESVNDGITVNIIYEGRAARVMLDSSKLGEIEEYYKLCEKAGSNEYEIDRSKKSTANLEAILGDPKRLDAVAKDFVNHYSSRVEEKSTALGKAMFVCASRKIAWELYKRIIKLKPDWAVPKSYSETKESIAVPKINLVMTRSKDDEKELYDLLGTNEDREKLDKLFKDEKSNFKIAIVVDMWITGFDVPPLDTMYIDKPIQKHTLIQTISRVNRVFEGKDNGLVVDYIGIKRRMDEALCQYTGKQGSSFDETGKLIVIVRDELQNLKAIFHSFNDNLYFSGNPTEQLTALNNAAEFVQSTEFIENRFMACVKRMKRAYNLCSASDEFSQSERNRIHFYLAVRGIIVKLTHGDAPDITQMNARVRKMIEEAIISDGVEALFTNDRNGTLKEDIFSEEYLERIEKLKLPNTKVKILEQLLTRLIGEYKKVNKIKAVDFTKRMKIIVEKYNNRNEEDLAIQLEAADKLIDVIKGVLNARKHHEDLGITFEEEAFYDILKHGVEKYKFEYPDDKLIMLAKKVKELVDDKTKYTDWAVQENIRAELRFELKILLDRNGYPPEPKDEVSANVIEQAENFKKYN